MAYLIDGNNLLGRVAPHALRDRTGRAELVAKLLAFQRVTRSRIHLVFDGPPGSAPPELAINAKFTVHFPAEGESADDLITAMIERQTDRRRFFVVTSDRDIRELAKRSGLSSVSSDDFAVELKRALKERKKQKEMEKRVEAPSPLEVDLWGKVFKERP